MPCFSQKIFNPLIQSFRANAQRVGFPLLACAVLLSPFSAIAQTNSDIRYGTTYAEQEALTYARETMATLYDTSLPLHSRCELIGSPAGHLASLQGVVLEAERKLQPMLALNPDDPTTISQFFFTTQTEYLFGSTLAKVNPFCRVLTQPPVGSYDDNVIQKSKEALAKTDIGIMGCGAARGALGDLAQVVFSDSQKDLEDYQQGRSAIKPPPVERQKSVRALWIYGALIEERCWGPNWLDKMKELSITDRDAILKTSRRLQNKIQSAHAR